MSETTFLRKFQLQNVSYMIREGLSVLTWAAGKVNQARRAEAFTV
jgi:hypothetical protein